MAGLIVGNLDILINSLRGKFLRLKCKKKSYMFGSFSILNTLKFLRHCRFTFDHLLILTHLSRHFSCGLLSRIVFLLADPSKKRVWTLKHLRLSLPVNLRRNLRKTSDMFCPLLLSMNITRMSKILICAKYIPIKLLKKLVCLWFVS